jgi:hypothetical protein
MNNNFNGNGFMPNVGFGYSGTTPQEPIAMNTPLTQENIEELRHNEQPVFGKKLTKDEYLRAICTHKDKNGNFTLRDNHDGTFTCSICKQTFHLIEPSETNIEEIQAICENFLDLFQTIKTMYGPIPEETAKDLYSISGFVPKFPKMYEIAAHYYQRLTPGQYTQSHYGNATQNQLWSLMSGGNMFGQGFGQAPQPFQPSYQQPVQYQPQYAQPQQPNNGYYPGTPNQAYAPAPNNPMGYQEQGAQIPITSAPQAPQNVQTTKTVQSPGPDVNAAFKG